MKKNLTISISSEALQNLKALRDGLSKDANATVKVESATIETQPGAAETISFLAIMISFASGLSSQVLGAWLYDKFLKPKSEGPAYRLHINGKEISTRAELQDLVDWMDGK